MNDSTISRLIYIFSKRYTSFRAEGSYILPMVSLYRGFSTIILIIVLFNSAMVQSLEEASQSLSNVFWSSIKVIVGDRSILDVPSGVLLSQHLTGILGPSGSGKSTFLNALSGRLLSNSKIPLIKRNILDVQADVACCDASFSEIGPLDKSGVAFVHQDDSFFGMLTVKETIGLASQLKHHNGSVDGLISLLGLMHVRDSRVGDIDRRGISGGERKRLAVACEMLGSPRLLLADEPTSGLDSFRAQQVVALLKSIAETHGIAAVASIHQPRSSIWSMLDDVLLLTAGGRVAYLGPRQDVVAFFRRLGYACPAATNPAEHLIDLVSVDTSSTTAAEKSRMRIAHIVDAFAMHTAYTANHSSVPNITSSATADAVSGTVVPGTGPEASSSTVKVFNPLKWLIHAHQAMTRSCVRLTLLLRRALKQSLRDHTTNLARLGVSIVLATVIGTVYSRDATSIAVNDAPYARVNEGDVGNRVNVIAQACINVGMLAVIKTLQIFKKERPVVSREFSQNQYSAAEYVISKTAAELPLDALIAGVFASLLHWRAGLAGQRSDFVGLLALQGCVCSTLGLAVSFRVDKPRHIALSNLTLFLRAIVMLMLMISLME